MYDIVYTNVKAIVPIMLLVAYRIQNRMKALYCFAATIVHACQNCSLLCACVIDCMRMIVIAVSDVMLCCSLICTSRADAYLVGNSLHTLAYYEMKVKCFQIM